MNEKIIYIFKNIYISLLSGIFSVYCLSFIGFLFHCPILKLYPVTGIIFFIILFIYLSKRKKVKNKYLYIAIICVALLFYFLGLLSYILIDGSWDGRGYHQVGIILLKNGYNPIYDNTIAFGVNLYKTFNPWSLMIVECYTKFSEILAANIYLLCGKLETGKMINYIFMFLSCIYSYITLNLIARNRDKNNIANIIIAFLMVFTPVTICQNATFYVDGLLYYSLINSLFSIANIEIEVEEKIHSASLLMNLIILANIKTVGLAYGIIMLLIWAFYTNIKNKCKKTNILTQTVILKKICITMLSFLLLAGISGINPYIINLKQGRHLLYPLMGENKIEIMNGNMPKSFRGRPSVYKLLMSTFGDTKNFTSEDEIIRLKIPFSIIGQSIFKYPDMRLGGFGYFWGGILLFSIYLLATLRFKNKSYKNIFCFLSVELLVLLLVNPEAWWARYAPWFWCIPLIICYFSILEDKNKNLAFVVLTLLFLNNLIIFIQNFAQTINISYFTNKFLESINKTKIIKLYNDNSCDETYVIKLEEKNINYKFVSENEYQNGCFVSIPKTSDKKLFIECNVNE